MKVLYLTNGLPHYFNLVLSRINRLPGIELVVLIPRGRSRYIGEGVYETRAGADFRIIELEEYTVRRLYASFRGLPGLLLRERPDVVVVPEHLALGFALRPALWILRRILRIGLILKSIPFGLPDYPSAMRQLHPEPVTSSRLTPAARVLWALKDDNLKRRAALKLRRYCFKMVDAHVNYVDHARSIYASYGVPPKKIFVTRNSPDTDAMREVEQALLAAGARQERSLLRLLHVGRLVPQKRVDLLLEAFQDVRIRVPQAELVIVGGGPDQERLRDLAAALGVSDGVRFVGPVYDPLELGRHFLSSSIFVLPGLGGLSINEAMFYGLAVVCAGGDGTERYLVREGYNGAFFRENDAASLADALTRLLSDPAGLARMHERSRAIIDSEVNIHTVVAEYWRAFRYACSRCATDSR